MGACSSGDILMLRCSWEPLNHLLDQGLEQLGARSWQECGNDKELFKYNPNWPRYQKMQDMDLLRFIAVRDDADELIGYVSVIFTDNLHDQSVGCAIVQDIFISPEKRGNGAADIVMDFVENQVCQLGAKHISMASRSYTADKWLQKRGYNSNERIHTKILVQRSIH